MFSFFKNPKFPNFLFISASILTLVLLFILFLGFRFVWLTIHPRYVNNVYYFDDNSLKQNDPLVTKVPQLDDSLKGPIINSIDPSLGSKNAPVTIVQYSDFQCEYCMKQEAALKKILNDYKLGVKIIWKDYPETDTSSLSWKSSLAARCAQKQNHFWEYHDLLYTNMHHLSDSKILEFAKNLSLNMNDFKKCLSDSGTANLLKDNITEANALNISGIPFVYVNDQELMGETSYEDIKKVVETELKK